MLEVYHFVNPLSGESLETEKKLEAFIAQSSRKLSVQILPVVTMQTIRDTAQQLGKETNYHLLSKTLYQLALDTKAVQFQGQKKSRHFLMMIQQALFAGQVYSDELIFTTLQQIGADKDVFIEDRKSNITIKAHRADQALAADLGIKQFPTLIVYDTARHDYAIRLNTISNAALTRIFTHTPQQLRLYNGYLNVDGMTEEG